MEKGENQLQVQGICNRLFNFVMSSFIFHSLKGGQVVHSVKPLKPIDVVQQRTSANEVHVELKRSNDADNSIHANALGGLAHDGNGYNATVGVSQGQMQDTANIPSSNESEDKEGGKDPTLSLDKVKTLENGFKLVPIPHVSKKFVNIEEGLEEIDIHRKQRSAPKGKTQEAMEAGKDSGLKSPRPLKPMLKITLNINEKSEASKKGGFKEPLQH